MKWSNCLLCGVSKIQFCKFATKTLGTQFDRTIICSIYYFFSTFYYGNKKMSMWRKKNIFVLLFFNVVFSVRQGVDSESSFYCWNFAVLLWISNPKLYRPFGVASAIFRMHFSLFNTAKAKLLYYFIEWSFEFFYVVDDKCRKMLIFFIAYVWNSRFESENYEASFIIRFWLQIEIKRKKESFQKLIDETSKELMFFSHLTLYRNW